VITLELLLCLFQEEIESNIGNASESNFHQESATQSSCDSESTATTVEAVPSSALENDLEDTSTTGVRLFFKNGILSEWDQNKKAPSLCATHPLNVFAWLSFRRMNWYLQ